MPEHYYTKQTKSQLIKDFHANQKEKLGYIRYRILAMCKNPTRYSIVVYNKSKLVLRTAKCMIEKEELPGVLKTFIPTIERLAL